MVGDAHHIQALSDPLEVFRPHRAGDTEVLVVDPTWRDGAFTDAFISAGAPLDHCSIVMYTAVSAEAMGQTLRLGQLGVRHLLLFDVDHDPALVLELIERIASAPVEELMLREVSRLTSTLPDPLIRAMPCSFERHLRYDTVPSWRESPV